MESSIRILNAEGLHARPAGVFVKKASEFRSQIFVRFNGQTQNAKSIMSLMSLGLKQNDEITLVADGEDAPAALEALESLARNRFQLEQHT